MLQRRRYLKGSGIVLALALAGCSDSDTDGSTAEDGTQSGEDANDSDNETQPDEPEDDEGEAEDDGVDYDQIDRGELEALTRTAVDEALEDEDDASPAEPAAEDDPEANNTTDTDGDAVDDPGNETDSPDEANESTVDGSETDEEGAGESPEAEDEPDLGGTVFAQVSYEGEWVIAYSTRSRTSSFDRSGLQTVEIDDDIDVVSIAVQKADDSTEELTALLLVDGRIMAEGSTTEAFGIAQATHSVFDLDE